MTNPDDVCTAKPLGPDHEWPERDAFWVECLQTKQAIRVRCPKGVQPKACIYCKGPIQINEQESGRE